MTGGQQFSSDNVNVIVNYDGYCPQWPGRSVGRSVNENIASVNAPESDSSSRRSIDENLGSGTIPEAGISARDSVDESVTFDKMGFKGEIGGHYVELEGTVQVRSPSSSNTLGLLTRNRKSTHKPKSFTLIFNFPMPQSSPPFVVTYKTAKFLIS